MKFKKISIPKNILDINFKFYFFIKELNSSTICLTENDIKRILEAYFIHTSNNVDQFKMILSHIVDTTIKSSEKKTAFENLFFLIQNQLELTNFIFALKLLQIKPLLLAEAKLIEIAELSSLQSINQLSLQYDTISKKRPYYTRVHGALLALLFFEKLENNDTAFIAESTSTYINSLFEEYKTLQQHGLQANQMFMLMFTESMNQSITTEAGSSYENRLFNVLINLGIPLSDIQKTHDLRDKSTEFDCYFKLEGKTIGIGAKRTLRERYKQFIKTVQMSNLDLMICITLGIDVTEQTAKNIRQHDVVLFVADEIYSSRHYLQEIDGIYPASQLTLSLLKQLTASK